MSYQINQTQKEIVGTVMYNQAEVQGATWTSYWHLKWGPSCGTEPLTCGIWCCLFIDSVRIELNYRTPGLMMKNCLVVWWNLCCPNSGIASSEFFSLKVGILFRLFWCGLQGWDRSKWENNSICCTHDLIRENENCVKMSLALKSSKLALNDWMEGHCLCEYSFDLLSHHYL